MSISLEKMDSAEGTIGCAFDCSSLKIITLESDTNLKNKKINDTFRKSLKKVCGDDFRLKSDTISAVQNIEFYEEPLTACSLECLCPLNNLQGIAQRWCKQASSETPFEWWLECDKNLFEDRWISVHKRKTVIKFSFGNLVGLNTFVEHYASNIPPSLCKVDFEHEKDRLIIRFKVNNKIYYLQVDYSSISRMLFFYAEQKTIDVCFCLFHPVLLYEVKPALGAGDASQSSSDSDQENGVNTKKVNNGSAQTNLSLDEVHSYHDWVRVLEFKDSKEELCSSNMIGMSTAIKLKLKMDDELWEAIVRLMQNCKKANAYFTPLTVKPPVKNINLNIPKDFPFTCRYALECIFSRSRQVKDQIGVNLDKKNAITEMLISYFKQDEQALERALLEISTALENGNVIIFDRALKTVYEQYHNGDPLFVPEGMIMIRKAVVTPTRVVFLRPQNFKTSRLLDKFDPRYALKVAVKDDNFERISFSLKGTTKSKKKFLEDVLKTKLMKKIKIGNVKYEVLGSSSSQLRQDGLWFYATDKNGRTAEDIRRQLGNFDEIKTVPKYMARIGLFLSQAQNRVDIPRECTTVEKDITGGSRPKKKPDKENPLEKTSKKNKTTYEFSDGIGKMSPAVAEKIYKKMNIEDLRPSAFQIRYAGCKGMLVVDPTMESDGEKIVFRKSMQKVKSDDTSLEILKYSAPRAVKLNRPLIMLLEQQHNFKGSCCQSTIMKLQSDTFKMLCRGLIYEDDAAHLLLNYSSLPLPYNELRKINISLTSEPFFRSMLHAIARRVIFDQKTKARIPIPLEYGRNVLGVLDETRTLKYGEVFIQYSTDPLAGGESPLKIHTGEVLVTKNPCMHRGDVRKFTAVDVPGLHHIKDCLVFPQRGKRPHPDEMAGSDLDGDEYVVIWHPDFLFEGDNFEAMDFTDPYKDLEEKIRDNSRTDPNETLKDWSKEVDYKITGEHMIDFFCHYIVHNNIGIIASRHLALADHERDGIMNKKLDDLVKAYSVALDSAKKGQFIEVKYLLTPRKYPNFMEKHEEKDTYVSDRLLGKLYQHCELFEMAIANSENTVQHLPDPTLQYPGWEDYKDNAENALKMYEAAISNLMRAYHISTEAEVVSSSFLKTSKYLKEKDESFDIKELVELQVKTLFAKMEEEFMKDFQSGNPSEEEMLKKASAWYMVTYQKQSKFFGLPWTVSSKIANLKILASLEGSGRYRNNPLISLIDCHIPNELQSENSEIRNLNVALELVFNWTKGQISLLSDDDDEQLDDHLTNLKNYIEKTLFSVIQSVNKKGKKLGGLQDAITSSRSKNGTYTAGQLVIGCLQTLSDMFFGQPPPSSEEETHVFEMGLLAFITLFRVACERNVRLLGIWEKKFLECEPVFATTGEQRINLKISLEDNKFGPWAARNMEALKEKLKDLTGVRELELLPQPVKIKCKEKRASDEDVNNVPVSNRERMKLKDKPKQNTAQYKEKWDLIVTARGNAYSLNQLKMLVIQSWFLERMMLICSDE